MLVSFQRMHEKLLHFSSKNMAWQSVTIFSHILLEIYLYEHIVIQDDFILHFFQLLLLGAGGCSGNPAKC